MILRRIRGTRRETKIWWVSVKNIVDVVVEVVAIDFSFFLVGSFA